MRMAYLRNMDMIKEEEAVKCVHGRWRVNRYPAPIHLHQYLQHEHSVNRRSGDKDNYVLFELPLGCFEYPSLPPTVFSFLLCLYLFPDYVYCLYVYSMVVCPIIIVIMVDYLSSFLDHFRGFMWVLRSPCS